jgi:hypothetical protein
VKYGVTGDYVLGLEVVLADGALVRLGGRTVKDVAGYDLKRLFVGSEGTLGVITEATLRLRPAPGASTTLVATFASLVDAGRAVSAIVATLRPSLLELMDRPTLAAIEAYRPMGLDLDAAALLLARSDAGEERGRAEIEAMAAACAAAGATLVEHTDDPAEGEMYLAGAPAFLPGLRGLRERGPRRGRRRPAARAAGHARRSRADRPYARHGSRDRRSRRRRKPPPARRVRPSRPGRGRARRPRLRRRDGSGPAPRGNDHRRARGRACSSGDS